MMVLMDDFSVSDEELEGLMRGSAPRADDNNRSRAQRTFDEAAPGMAQAIIDIAQDRSANPNTRLKAAQYALDRVLGTTSLVNGRNEIDDLLLDAVKSFTKAE